MFKKSIDLHQYYGWWVKQKRKQCFFFLDWNFWVSGYFLKTCFILLGCVGVNIRWLTILVLGIWWSRTWEDKNVFTRAWCKMQNKVVHRLHFWFWHHGNRNSKEIHRYGERKIEKQMAHSTEEFAECPVLAMKGTE